VNTEKLKAAATLNLLLGGIPLIYYGQEIGMKGTQLKGATDGNDIPIREAFEWTADAKGNGMAFWYKNTGPWWDSTHVKGPWWDSTHVKPHDGISVEEQQTDINSLFNHYKKMIELKKSNPALAYGKYKVAENSNDHVFSFYRFTDTEKILVVVNLSGSPEQALVGLKNINPPKVYLMAKHKK